MACMMCIVAGLMVSLFVPNGSINKLYSFLRRIWGGQESPEDSNGARKSPRNALWGHFGVRFGSVWGQFGYRWVTLGHLMVTLQSLWIHLWYMKVLFQKTFIFPTYFNDFIKLFGGLWVDLGLLWDRFWHMKVNLGPLWGHFGATLGI